VPKFCRTTTNSFGFCNGCGDRRKNKYTHVHYVGGGAVRGQCEDMSDNFFRSRGNVELEIDIEHGKYILALFHTLTVLNNGNTHSDQELEEYLQSRISSKGWHEKVYKVWSNSSRYATPACDSDYIKEALKSLKKVRFAPVLVTSTA